MVQVNELEAEANKTRAATLTSNSGTHGIIHLCVLTHLGSEQARYCSQLEIECYKVCFHIFEVKPPGKITKKTTKKKARASPNAAALLLGVPKQQTPS